MMKLNSVFLLAVLAVFTACNNSDELLLSDAALEIKGIDAVIDSHRQVTRTVDELKVNVGRTSFVANDHIVFTTIKRTDSALEPLLTAIYSMIVLMIKVGTVLKVIHQRKYIGQMVCRLILLLDIACLTKTTFGRIMVMALLPVNWGMTSLQ